MGDYYRAELRKHPSGKSGEGAEDVKLWMNILEVKTIWKKKKNLKIAGQNSLKSIESQIAFGGAEP